MRTVRLSHLLRWVSLLPKDFVKIVKHVRKLEGKKGGVRNWFIYLLFYLFVHMRLLTAVKKKKVYASVEIPLAPLKLKSTYPECHIYHVFRLILRVMS